MEILEAEHTQITNMIMVTTVTTESQSQFKNERLRPSSIKLQQVFLAGAVFLFVLGSSLPAAAFLGPISYLYGSNGQKLAEELSNYDKVNWQKLDKQTGVPFSGVAAVEISFSSKTLSDGTNVIQEGNCSGSLLLPPGMDLEKAGRSKAPAYLLTAGHCYRNANGASVGSKERVVGAEIIGTAHFLAYGDETQEIQVPVKSWKYASQTQQDIGILELDSSLGSLVQKGLKPLSIASTLPEEQSSVVAIGIPRSFSGSTETRLRKADQVTHLSRCSYEGLISEDLTYLGETPDSDKFFMDKGRLMNCSASSGMSGGALIDEASGQILGVIAAVVPYHTDLDALGNETLAQFSGFNYASDPFPLLGCFSDDGTFQLRLVTCDLLRKKAKLRSYQQACEEGEVQLCEVAAYAALGASIQRGEDKNENHFTVEIPSNLDHAHIEKSLKYFDLGCDYGSGDLCYYSAARWIDFQKTLPKTEQPRGTVEQSADAGGIHSKTSSIGAIVVDRLAKACKRGVGVACGYLGDIFSEQTGIDPDALFKSLGFYARACALYSAKEYCPVAAGVLSKGLQALGDRLQLDSPGMIALGQNYLNLGCNMGDMSSCLRLQSQELAPGPGAQ